MPALVLVSSRAEARSAHRSGVTRVPSSQDRANLRFRDRCTQQVRAFPSVSPALGRANLIHLPVSSRGPNSPAFQGKEVLAKPVNHLHQYVASDGIARASTAVLQSHTARTFSRRHFELGRPECDPRISFAAEADTVITPPQLRRALELIDPQASHPARDISRLADRANRELAA